MKLECTREAIACNGKKIMEFTYGVVYEAFVDEEDTYYVYDDNDDAERFFNPFIMFKEVKV